MNSIVDTILMIPAILVAMTFHEYAHALVAVKLGDNTPKYQGRLTLNPFAHIDILGFLMILLMGFGWGKPVQINPNALKNYYKDDLKISIAGPLANLFCALASAILLALSYKIPFLNNNLGLVVINIINYIVLYNCLWCFLNLLPIPGFDGFSVVRDLFPRKFYKLSNSIYRYQFIIFIILILPIFRGSSILSFIIGIPSKTVYKFLINTVFSII